MYNPQHNGNGLPRRKRTAALELLSAGFSISEVARRIRSSRQTVAGLRDVNLSRIEQANEIIANQWRRVASHAVDRMQDQLSSRARIPMRELIPLAGVATDKIVMLSRGNQLPDLHAHLHQHLHITEQQAKDAAKELIANRLTSQPNE